MRATGPAGGPRDHGGGIDAARARWGGARTDWLDLSTGINPVPWPREAGAGEARGGWPLGPRDEAWTALPDAEATARLVAAARRAWAVPDAASVLAVPGASAAIALLPRLVAPGRVAIPGPTYNEHAAAFAAAGWTVTPFPQGPHATPGEALPAAGSAGGRADLRARSGRGDGDDRIPDPAAASAGRLVRPRASGAAGRSRATIAPGAARSGAPPCAPSAIDSGPGADGGPTGVGAPAGAGGPAEAVVVVHPNNPDGRRWRAEELPRAPLTVIDESFCDLVPQASLIALAARPGVVVLKSFGKFWGLAGLRLGFAIGDPALIARLAQALGPWPVSGPALAVGAAALDDGRWAERARARLASDARRLDGLLGAHGAPAGGTDLFRLLRVPDAAGFAGRLARARVLVRSFPWSRELVRVGLPGPEGWARLEAALRDAPRPDA